LKEHFYWIKETWVYLIIHALLFLCLMTFFKKIILIIKYDA